MYILIIFLHLYSGQVQPRVAIAHSQTACIEALPLHTRLYAEGKFSDGPPATKIKRITGRCEPVEL